MSRASFLIDHRSLSSQSSSAFLSTILPLALVYGGSFSSMSIQLSGKYSEKGDVYGFGLLLLEVITGRKFHEVLRDDNGVTVMKSVWERREPDRVLKMVDHTLSDFPEDEVKRFVDVALACIQFPSNNRPSMSEVLCMLLGPYEFDNKVLRNPEHPFWSSNHNEVDFPSEGKAEISLASSDAIPQIPVSSRNKELLEESNELPNKATRGFEKEIESDLDTCSRASELMEISRVLETELYRSIEENISKPSVSRPRLTGKNVVKAELVRRLSLSTSIDIPSSLCTDIHVDEEIVEAVKLTQMSHDVEAELQMSEPSQSGCLFDRTAVDPDEQTTSVAFEIIDTDFLTQPSHDVEVELQISEPPQSEILFDQIAVDPDVQTTSAAFGIFNQNEEVHSISCQAGSGNMNEVLARPVQCTVEKIVEAFKDPHHRRIGLYGRGGSGKTTVLKNLSQHAAAKEFFDQLVFVTVPKFAYQKHVRDEIAQQLSLNVQVGSCTEDEICSLIHQALIDRKLLLLLDDVQESINLHEIGVPNPGPEGNYWVVLATRCLDVCHSLADREIEMEVLSDAEAWTLFSNQVEHTIHSPDIEPYARAIIQECYGSPVIILAIGSALRAERSVEEWKLALRKIQFDDTANKNVRNLFSQHVNYCYDRLKDRDLKTCFLYTALFQQDKEIEISVLLECFVGEGLVGGTTVAAYDRGYDIIRHLANASLIEINDNGLVVKMHNVVKDSALEILLSDIEGYRVLARLPESELDEDQFFQKSIQFPCIHKYFTRAGANLKEPPSTEEWEQATMIFLMDNKLSSLPSKLSCSNLVALLLQRNCSLRAIPSSFFDSMSTLRVLNLSRTRIKSLPDSFSKLKSLQILLLRDCERLFVLPPSIGLLKLLEVLDLQGTEVTHLPDSFDGLASLKQLRISFYGSMNHSEYKKLPSKLVTDGIFSSLKLRELGMFVYPGDRRWTLNASGITKEISSLKLSLLYFCFPNVDDLEYFVHASQSWKDRGLSKFKFIVGHDFKRIVPLVSNEVELFHNESQQCLRFVNGESIPPSLVEVLTRATSFYLDHHLSICYLSQFGIECFNDLKICIIQDCPELEGILDCWEQGREFLPQVEYLSISHLWNLEGIWGSRVKTGSFARLKILSVHACPKLRYVLTCSMIEILSCLNELVIEDCASLKYVVIKHEDVKEIIGDTRNEVIHERKPDKSIACGHPVLRNLKKLKLHYLPEMCEIWRVRWPPLEYMSFYDCPKLRNLHMEGDDGMNIKEIVADIAWWDSLEWEEPVLSSRLKKCVTQIQNDDL
ncbi:disease resistance protein At4g27190-like isoform X3 [Amaranthus tricolor]|uniref:disease resistance protein At4g27190-like isoform X3 n=1 Tax=Amaranthus tricolor TaxID=29722 RepID=UPI00258DF6DD|nr:disease resistance protein At4g27190-like isoform X3 [Amaranthus tricolor]